MTILFSTNPSQKRRYNQAGTRIKSSRYSYGDRHWALYDHGELVAVTLYKKGAFSVKSRLEMHEETIAEQQRQIETLTTVTPIFRHKAARRAEQLPLIAAEALDAYRVTRPKDDTPETP